MIRQTLLDLGHDVEDSFSKKDNPQVGTGTAPVGLTFAQPHQFLRSHDYNIGYFPWESTELKDGWEEHLDAMDEVWVTSPWVKSVVEQKTDTPVYVYCHGYNSDYSIRHRVVNDRVRFLFMGAEAARKNFPFAIRAWRAAFQGRDDVELVVKSNFKGIDIWGGQNIVIHNGIVPHEELAGMFFDSHFMFNTSAGEGFNLPGLDALAAGMPLIAPKGYLAYEDKINPNLLVSTSMVDSPWPSIHPGQVFEPDFDETVDTLLTAVDMAEELLSEAVTNAIVDEYWEYSWENVTSKAFSELADRLGL